VFDYRDVFFYISTEVKVGRSRPMSSFYPVLNFVWPILLKIDEKPSVLIADDHDVSRDNLLALLSENGFNVKAVEDGQQAIDAFLGEKFDLVIADLKMPRVDGLQLLEFIKGISAESVVIIVTGHGTVGTAVEAMKLGAFDYITNP